MKKNIWISWVWSKKQKENKYLKVVNVSILKYYLSVAQLGLKTAVRSGQIP